LGHDALQLGDEHLHPLIAATHVLKLALGVLAPGPFGVDLPADLKRLALELRDSYLQLLLISSYRRSFGRCGLFGLGELALNALQLLGKVSCAVLTRAQMANESLDLGTTITLEVHVTVLGLDAQLLLGVLALLDTTQLVLTLRSRSLLGLELLGEDNSLLRGLQQLLLKAGQMCLERTYRCLCYLSTTCERIRRLDGLSGIRINRPPCAPCGQEIVLGCSRRIASRYL
jgi:hypothetical protein